jgi:transposase
MPKAYPQEFREDVVRIARLGELTYAQIARDFGISETCVSNWVRKADIEDGKWAGDAVGAGGAVVDVVPGHARGGWPS